MNDKNDAKIAALPQVEQDKLAASIAMLRRNMTMIIEHQALLAQIRKASYDLHVKQGFTPAQALELCKGL